MASSNINDALMKSAVSAVPSTGDDEIDKIAENLRTHFILANSTDPYFEQKYIRAQNALIDYVWYQNRPTKLHYQEKASPQYSDPADFFNYPPQYHGGGGAPRRSYGGYQSGSAGGRRYPPGYPRY